MSKRKRRRAGTTKRGRPIVEPKLTQGKVRELGSIRADEALPLAEFLRRIGCTRHWLRSAKRKGLVVRERCSRKFVIGADFIAFLMESGQ